MSRVTVELAIDRSAMVPGEAAMLGIRFVIEDRWHLYWKNSGDSGMPIMIEFDAPEGVEIGPIRWPAPERYVYGNGSVDYIYEHEVALLAPVEIDARFGTDQRIEIGATIELLACQEACVFGMTERTLVIDTAESSSMTEPDWMKKNRARIPDSGAHPAQISWDGTDLLIKAWGYEGLNRVSFFPSSPSEIRPIDPAVDGTSATGALRIAYPRDIVGAPQVAGVLEIETAASGTTWIEIETTPPGGNADENRANEPTPAPAHNQPIKNRSGD